MQMPEQQLVATSSETRVLVLAYLGGAHCDRDRSDSEQEPFDFDMTVLSVVWNLTLPLKLFYSIQI